MCKSKQSTRTMDSISRPRSDRSGRTAKLSEISRTRETASPELSRTKKPSSSDLSPKPKPSTSYPSTSYGSFTTTSTYRDSSRTSASSKTSLSSLRASLPENPNIYDFSEILQATNNFLAKRFSSSSLTSAWRCSIRGKDVIVFQRKSRRSIETPELRELLSVICKSHHTSLVKLLGASISDDNIFLVYEYVNGASLAHCLRNPNNYNFTVLSSWMSRMQIATDIAQGLEYIHHYTGLKLSSVHNYIDTSSVIVIEPFSNARICHFGTAELCGEITRHPNHPQQQQNREITEIKATKASDDSSVTRDVKVQGTVGYMSPEFKSEGIPTQKSDVYAFGVVILELLSGEEPLKFKLDEQQGEMASVSLIETAREALESSEPGRIRRWMDRRLKDSFPVEVVEKITRLALDCCHVEPDKRPDMKRVAGKFSKFYLESRLWCESVSAPADFTVSLAPR